MDEAAAHSHSRRVALPLSPLPFLAISFASLAFSGRVFAGAFPVALLSSLLLLVVGEGGVCECAEIAGLNDKMPVGELYVTEVGERACMRGTSEEKGL